MLAVYVMLRMVLDWFILVKQVLILDSCYFVFFLALPGVCSKLCWLMSSDSTECTVYVVAASFFIYI